MKILPILLSDSYKQFHFKMYPDNLTKLYSNMTPRKSRLGTQKAVWFGMQYYLKEYLIKQWNEQFFQVPLEDILKEYKRFHKNFSFTDIDVEHIIKLHKLGYLPLEIKALSEGSEVPMRVPFFTITNTHPDFAWLVNFLETAMSTVTWDLTTVATIAREYRTLLDKYAIETTGTVEGVQWQGHDFSMRGRSSVESSFNQAGHLLSFTGTDTIPAVLFLEEYYGANIEKELVGSSVPATEHSVMMCGGKESEIETFETLLDKFPTGIISVVSDTWDLWEVCTKFLPKLKDKILARDGKLVIRPDSGDPVDIICGNVSKSVSSIEEMSYFLSSFFYESKEKQCYFSFNNNIYLIKRSTLEENRDEYGSEQMFDFNKSTKISDIISGGRYSYITKENISIEESKGVVELLWDIFGGTINDKGYKVLNPHIGAIYGDSITLERAEQICERLKAKGFASTNVVLGIGSYTYNYNTRDTLGMAIKATYCETKELIQGTMDKNPRETTLGHEIFKDPITDDGTKKSAKGLLCVVKDKEDNLVLCDQVSWVEEGLGELKTVFKDGKLIKETTLGEIRNRLNN